MAPKEGSEEPISTATATKRRPVEWTCARCEMTSRWTLGLEDGLEAPPNWAREDDGNHYCLICRRERAIDKALADAGEIGTEARAKLRSAAVVEFEIKRDPKRTEGEIAKASRASVAAVRKARQRLGMKPVTSMN